MRVGTVVKIAAVGVAVFVVGLIAVVKSLDVNQYRSLIAEQVTAATGRDLAIHGDLHLALSLSPSLVVEDVAFANMPGGSRDEMVRVKRLEAKVALLPLITGTVRVERLVLVEPDVLLEVDAQGQGNWVLGPPTADTAPQPDAVAATGEAPSTEVEINSVRIEKARIAWHDARAGTVTNAAFDYLDISAPNASAPLGIDGKGRVNTQPFTMEGSVGTLRALTGGEAFPLKLTLTNGGFLLTVDGTAGASAVDIAVAAEGTEAADLLRLAGVEAPTMGPFRFRGRLKGDESAMALADIDAAVGKAQTGRIAATGSVRDLTGVKGIDVALEVRSEKPAGLSALLGVEVPPAGAVSLDARVADTPEGLRLSGLSGRIGESDIAGEATVALAGERPAVTARLTSRTFRTVDVLGPPAPKDDAADAADAAAAPASGRLIPDIALPTGPLRALDADVTWTVERLVAGEVEAEGAELRLRLADGRLTVAPSARLAGGALTAEATLADGATPTAGLSVNAEGVEIGALLRALRATEMVSGGAAELRIDLNGSGATLREMLAATAGTVAVTMNSARVDNRYAEFMAFDVMREIAPWAGEENVTVVQCMVGRWTVTDGVADTATFLFDTANMTLAGEGTIDLGTERLDLVLAPRPKQASLMNLAMPMDIGGTFAKPTVLPNKAGAIKGLAGLAGAAALGPAGLLVPFVSTGSGDENQCVQALDDAAAGRAGSEQQAPASGDPVKDTMRGISEGVGGFLGRALGN